MTNYDNWFDYSNAVYTASGSVSQFALDQAKALIRDTSLRGHMTYIAGNGGSAAIADHLCCDWQKGLGIRAVSLSSNAPLLTAIANDLGYENSIARQLGALLKPGDLVILISSSGQSPNIKKAVDKCRQRENKVIGISGMGMSYLSENADVSLLIDSDNYGVIEDLSQSIMHSIAQSLLADAAGPRSGAV